MLSVALKGSPHILPRSTVKTSSSDGRTRRFGGMGSRRPPSPRGSGATSRALCRVSRRRISAHAGNDPAREGRQKLSVAAPWAYMNGPHRA
jgi:hypothetical protein